MAEEIGARIKEARLAAGMSQKALAEAVDGVSASSISRAERGLKELTDEQLEAIAKATGSESLLDEVKEETPKADAEKPEAPAVDEKDAPSAPAQDQDPLAAVAGMLGSMAGGTGDANPLAAVLGGGAGDANSMAALAGLLGNMAGSKAEKESGNPLEAILGDEKAMAALMGLLGSMAGGTEDANPLAAVLGGGAGDANSMAALAGLLGSMAGGKAEKESKAEKDSENPLQAILSDEKSMAALAGMLGSMMSNKDNQ